jgi:hypothetical protein
MCSCKNCIQMYNVHRSYSRFICYRINELKDNKLSKLNPITKRGKEAESELNNYQNIVKPNGEHQYPTAKDAMFCGLCAPPDEEYQSLHKLDCVLGKCKSCPGYDRPLEEMEMTNAHRCSETAIFGPLNAYPEDQLYLYWVYNGAYTIKLLN